MKTFIVVLVLAALGWWAYSHGYLKPEWSRGSAGTAPSASAPADSLQDALNRGLPRMVNNDISLDRVAASNVVVSFNYRLVDLDEYAANQRYGSTMPAEMQGALVRDVCGNRAAVEQLLARGRDVQIQVHSQDGRTMFNAQVRPGGC